MKKEEGNLINKKGQLTIFIIIAILIIGAVALFFLLRQKAIAPEAPPSPEITNPNSFLKSCIEDDVKETIKILEMQGGYIENPLSIKFQFGNEEKYNISYLCYTSAYYTRCSIQEPSIINHMEQEFQNELNESMENCFDELVKSYQNKGYAVSGNYSTLEANLVEDKLILNLKSELSLKKEGSSSRYKSFKLEFPTGLYNLGLTAQKIVEDEASFGSFNDLSYGAIYPQYNINVEKIYDQTKIYTIVYKNTNEKFRIAIKGYVFPI